MNMYRHGAIRKLKNEIQLLDFGKCPTCENEINESLKGDQILKREKFIEDLGNLAYVENHNSDIEDELIKLENGKCPTCFNKFPDNGEIYRREKHKREGFLFVINNQRSDISMY